jgi:hypothetical protein
MSALPVSSWRGHFRVAPPILRDSPYTNDRGHFLNLLASVCSEQQGRFHTLQLLSEYLAARAGRKHQVAASEMKALRELYEATWCELNCAFPAELVRWAKAAVERHAS